MCQAECWGYSEIQKTISALKELTGQRRRQCKDNYVQIGYWQAKLMIINRGKVLALREIGTSFLQKVRLQTWRKPGDGKEEGKEFQAWEFSQIGHKWWRKECKGENDQAWVGWIKMDCLERRLTLTDWKEGLLESILRGSRGAVAMRSSSKSRRGVVWLE